MLRQDLVPGSVSGRLAEGLEVAGQPVRGPADVVVRALGPVAEVHQLGAGDDLARLDGVDPAHGELLVVVRPCVAPLLGGEQQRVGDLQIAVGRRVAAVDALARLVPFCGVQVRVVDRGVGQDVLEDTVEGVPGIGVRPRHGGEDRHAVALSLGDVGVVGVGRGDSRPAVAALRGDERGFPFLVVVDHLRVVGGLVPGHSDGAGGVREGVAPERDVHSVRRRSAGIGGVARVRGRLGRVGGRVGGQSRGALQEQGGTRVGPGGVDAVTACVVTRLVLGPVGDRGAADVQVLVRRTVPAELVDPLGLAVEALVLTTGRTGLLAQFVVEEDVLRSGGTRPFDGLLSRTPPDGVPGGVVGVAATFLTAVGGTTSGTVVVGDVRYVALEQVVTLPAAVQVEVRVEVVADHDVARGGPLEGEVPQIA